MLQSRYSRGVGFVVAAGVLALAPAMTFGMPPAPANDDPAAAEVIGPAVPILVLGSSVLGDNSINTTGGQIPAIDTYMDGPDVFYSFTPATTDLYRFQLFPWQRAPLRSSDRRFTIYAYEQGTGTYVGGIRAPGSARPVNLDVQLTAQTEYIFGVDHDDITHDNFQFTLLVDTLFAGDADNCSPDAQDITSATLPVVLLNDIDGAIADFLFEQSTGRCSVSGTTGTTAPGIDHVYKYTAPADGEYAIELVGSGFDAVLYVDDSCDPFFLDGCMGASNHSTSGTSGGKHELVVVTFEQGKDYYIFVDNGSTTANSGPYALVIDDAFNYEVNELEPNDVAATATAIDTPLNGGQLVGPVDEDWWAVTGLTGDRVYAWVNNGGSSNSTLDTDLAFYGTDGLTLIEFDDEDGDGAVAPIEDLRYIYSTTSAVIAGAQMTTDGTHYFQVTDQNATGTVHRYRFHVGVEPATRAPLQEVEPNDTLATADYSGKHYYAGVIPTVDDADFYAFEATVGDRVFMAFDGDPERDATGSDSGNTDPNAFHGKLVVYDPAGDILISDISDSNSIQSAPDYPAQGGFFVARTTGTHYVEVKPQSTSSQVGPTETYHLAIFLNDAAPAMAEEVDPVITQTPDFANNWIDVEATDDQVGDSGICDVSLVAAVNLQLTGLAFTPGDGVVTFRVETVNPAEGGTAKLIVADCVGNTAIENVVIDVDPPVCDGVGVSTRIRSSLHGPLHVPDNDLAGLEAELYVADAGLITDVNVTVTIDTFDPGDIDLYLISPTGTSVELVTDRMSSLGIDMVDTAFDDSADEILPILSSAAPYTGTWLPEDPAGLAKVNGEQAQGTWKLQVVDDASSADFGATLVSWTLEIGATFSGPQTFEGTASDTVGVGAGIDSIVLTDAVNVELNLPPEFTPGDPVVEYTVTLIDVGQNGSGTMTVTDLAENTCQSLINLNGAVDTTGPSNTGAVTTDLTFKQEVEAEIPQTDLNGVLSTINVPDSFTVGEVEVALEVYADDQGRISAELSHGGQAAMLVNRISMDERQALGNSKSNFDVYLDDDAPVEDDIHLEPSLGTIATLGLHQTDGRGEFWGDGITVDDRDNMLFALANQDVAGDWDLVVADTRERTGSDGRLRRWALTLKSPCGPERYVGQAIDLTPESGICSIDLAAGATNLQVVASFTPGDEIVDYRVELVDPALPGSGTVEITDCATNVTTELVALTEASADQNPPAVGGTLNLGLMQFEGSMTELNAGDTGFAELTLAPWADNLEIVSITPNTPGATTVDFVIGLVDKEQNGRGYVRVTDQCGWRSYVLVEIDTVAPICTGSIEHTKRYFSTDLPAPIPDNNAAGVSSNIIVGDTDLVEDVNVTLNIVHGSASNIDLAMTSPSLVTLFTDVGSIGNNFIDTTLDDEAAETIPTSSSAAPFTGEWQPEGGPALFILDGSPAAGTYTMRPADDATYDLGTFESWSLEIEASTFPPRYDGRVEASEAHTTGVCSVDLQPGATNLTLVLEPWFVAGGDSYIPDLHVVRYSVELTDPGSYGEGTVEVEDCGGNTCVVPLCIELPGDKGDLDRSGDVDLVDHDLFFDCLTGPDDAGFDCGDDCALADFNDDGGVDLVDFAAFQRQFP